MKKDAEDFICVFCSQAQHYGIESDISIDFDKFACGENFITINESIRNKHIIIIQSFATTIGNSINDNIMELLLTVDTVKRAGAATATTILPIFPYARQDRKSKPGTPISARVICDMLEAVGVDRVITLDIHANQIQGFLKNTVIFDTISGMAFLAHHIKKIYHTLNDIVICSPDAGGVKRGKEFGRLLGVDNFCMLDKMRIKANEVESMQVIGNVNGAKVLIIDDMIDTGGTIETGTDVLYAHGALDVRVVATHGIFSGPAFERLTSIPTYVTNSCPIPNNKPDNISVIDLKNFILELIHRVKHSQSMSELFSFWQE